MALVFIQLFNANLIVVLVFRRYNPSLAFDLTETRPADMFQL
jgi:hypothetical protein